jgi:hypothetical protein
MFEKQSNQGQMAEVMEPPNKTLRQDGAFAESYKGIKRNK